MKLPKLNKRDTLILLGLSAMAIGMFFIHPAAALISVGIIILVMGFVTPEGK